MPEIIIRRKIFACSKIGESVTIEQEILIHRSGATGDVDMEVVRGWDCDHKSHCDVCRQERIGVSYDWEKCVYNKQS